MNLYAIDWYGVHLPRTKKELIQKGINSLEFIKAITGRNDIIVNLHESNMPAYDVKNKQMLIPRVMFNEKYFTEELGINQDLVQQFFIPIFLTVYNGFQIHESLHIILSPQKTFDGWAGYFQQTYKPFPQNFVNTIIFRCMNLVEDLYIENVCKLEYPNMYPFITDTSELIFNDAMFDLISNQMLAITDETPLDQQVKTIYGYLTFFKNPLQREKMAALTPNYTNIMQRMLKDTRIIDRDRTKAGIDLGLEILKNLKIKNKSQDDINNECSSASDGENTLESNGINSFEAAEQAFEELMKSLSPSELNELKDIENKLTEYYKIVRNKSENIKPDIIYQNIMELEESRYKPKNQTEWNNFARMLNRFIVNRNKPTIARKEGVEIIEDNLYRTKTDGYVFGKPKPKDKRKRKPTIRILIDVSGSVEYMLERIANNVYGLCVALNSVNIEYAVYAHTTGYKNNKSGCMIYGIASNGVQLYDKKVNSSLTNAFNRVKSIDCGGNYDGYALEWTANTFPNDGSPQLLIYFSDGQPNNFGYSSEDAIEHTKRMANEARKKGIHTWVVSLDKNVVKDNNNIYGKEYNIDASDLTKLTVNLQTLVSNLLIGKGKT